MSARHVMSRDARPADDHPGSQALQCFKDHLRATVKKLKINRLKSNYLLLGFLIQME